MKYYVKIDNYWNEYDPSDKDALISIFKEIYGEKEKFDISKLELAKAEKQEDLNWENTSICNNSYRTGWLSPEGVFFGCESWFHNNQANLVHKKEEKTLENEGWVKITYDDSSKKDRVFQTHFYSDDNNIFPTKEQLDYVKEKYPDAKHLYYALWDIAQYKKSLIQQEWGL